MAAAVLGAAVTGTGAFAATNWVIGLGSGSSGESQSAGVSNLTITATAGGANLLYPGGNGDVTVSIANPNPYPVTITAVQLPTDTTYATGYTTSALSVTQSGCLASTPSDVIWNYSSATSGSCGGAGHSTKNGLAPSGTVPATTTAVWPA